MVFADAKHFDAALNVGEVEPPAVGGKDQSGETDLPVLVGLEQVRRDGRVGQSLLGLAGQGHR
ncbi:MAG: hypothetical protein DME25_22270, partial [Verrucomicrobia bacterium]